MLVCLLTACVYSAFIAKAPAERSWLLLTALVVTAFVVLHIQHFRLRFVQWSDGRLTGLPLEPGRDLYREAQLLLASPWMASFYCIGCAALSAHSWLGWDRAVKKIGLRPSCIPFATVLGRVAAVLLGTGFILVSLFFHTGASSAAALVYTWYDAWLHASLTLPSPTAQRNLIASVLIIVLGALYRSSRRLAKGPYSVGVSSYGSVDAAFVTRLRQATAPRPRFLRG